jgi:hypothetical protein
VKKTDHFAPNNLDASMLTDQTNHSRLVEVSVDLSSARADGEAFTSVEVLELDRGSIGRDGHRSAECVDLTNQVTLRLASDGRITGHSTDGSWDQGYQEDMRPSSCCSEGGLNSSMTTTNDDDHWLSWGL